LLRRLLSRLVAERRPAVLCLHRENLPDVLTEACSALGAPAAVPADPGLPKSGFWVAHASVGGSGPAAAGGKASRVSRAGLVALERYKP
jgi:8-oxo-dGTP diphosphatase